MLNRAVVERLLSDCKGQQASNESVFDDLRAAWNRMCVDESYAKERFAACGFNVSESISCVKRSIIAPAHTQYTVAGIDGSQIYSDHHIQWYGCFMHAATYSIAYSTDSASRLDISHDARLFMDRLYLDEEVGQLRDCLERAAAFRASACYDLVLIDGPLQGFSSTRSQHVVDACCCFKLHQKRNLFGYVSMPPSTIISDLLAAGGSIQVPIPDAVLLPKLCDGSPGIIGPWAVLEGAGCKKWYWWMIDGAEVVRIEWYGTDHPDVADLHLRYVVDQIQKGGGYPIVLAEAHHAAVITLQDRDFFISRLSAYGMLRVNRQSRKLSSKRRVCV